MIISEEVYHKDIREERKRSLSKYRLNLTCHSKLKSVLKFDKIQDHIYKKETLVPL